MNKKNTLILFTGDSITDGNRYKKKSQEWDLNHQIGHSYAYIINGLLGSLYPDRNFSFKNRGISGNRIIDLYARINGDLLDLKPDILSILVGVNDGPIDLNAFKPTPSERFEQLYRMFLTEIQANLPECKIVLMEPFICNAGKLRENFEEWEDCIYKYAAIVKKLSKEFNTIFIPLQEKFNQACLNKKAEYWSWDGIHPTENGHGLIALEWLKCMKNELEL